MPYESTLQSLLEWVEETGCSLPFPPEEIAQYEALGCIVDLQTGAVLPGQADRRDVLDLEVQS